jgi:hypothetical protein
MVLYKPHHRLDSTYRIWHEIERQEDFQMIRIGGKYSIELPKEWEPGFSLVSVVAI